MNKIWKCYLHKYKREHPKDILTLCWHFGYYIEAMVKQTSVKAGQSVDTDKLSYLCRRTLHFLPFLHRNGVMPRLRETS